VHSAGQLVVKHTEIRLPDRSSRPGTRPCGVASPKLPSRNSKSRKPVAGEVTETRCPPCRGGVPRPVKRDAHLRQRSAWSKALRLHALKIKPTQHTPSDCWNMFKRALQRSGTPIAVYRYPAANSPPTPAATTHRRRSGRSTSWLALTVRCSWCWPIFTLSSIPPRSYRRWPARSPLVASYTKQPLLQLRWDITLPPIPVVPNPVVPVRGRVIFQALLQIL